MVAGSRAPTREPFRVKVSWSGTSAVAAGALTTTCWPRNVNPVGALSVTPPTAIPTLPPAGTVTATVTGALTVGPVPGSVVRVPAGGRVWATVIGGDAAARGVTGLEAADGSLVPAAFVAVTVNVYVVSSTRLMVAVVVSPLTVNIGPDGWDVTAYPVIGLPPSEGAAQLTEAVPSPAAATTL